MTILEAALEFHAAGLSAVAARADGSKAPFGAWARYQHERMTSPQLEQLFSNTTLGLGFITGTISNNTFLLEVEGRAAHELPGLAELAEASGLGELWQRINAGWLELSPSGGVHWLVRVENSADVPRSTKLARDINNVTLAEIKGEGGFVITAPSAGAVHPTGKPWVRLTGGPTSIPTLTPDELEAVLTLLRTIDHAPEQHQPVAPSGPVSDLWAAFKPQDGDVTPGDDYEARTDWTEILTGWTHIFTRGATKYWRRPGKKDGISATTGHAGDRDRLYVFTSSTEFDPETAYTKFGAHALLHHAGDHSAAAKQLAADQYGHRAPRALTPAPGRHLVAVPSSAREQPTGTSGPAPQPKPSAFVTSDDSALTDTGNARLLAAEYTDRLRYIPDAGRWASWTGSRWEWSPDDAPALQAALDIADRLPTDNDQIRKHRIRSLSTRALTNVIRLARTLPQLRTPAAEFDTHAWQLNTPNGIVDLASGTLAAATPNLFHSKETAVPYNPAQPTPLWNRFLETTFGGDTTMITYVQRLAGVALVGTVIEHVLPFLHGAGGNGKSVFLETITSLLGDYATEAPHGFLLAGRDRHETELANLQARRFVVASEINEGTKFDEAKVKALTGGDKITARFMRQDFFTFVPSHMLWLMGNNQPKVESGGHSFWRRLRLIPFTRIIAEADRIDNLQQRLVEEEGPGILAWLVTGAIDYHQSGLDEPANVRAATDAYKAEEDHLARFIDDTCILGGGTHARLETAELRRLYDLWCRSENEHELSGQVFGRQLKQKFEIEVVRSNGRRYYTGLMLQGHDDADAGGERSGLFNDHWSNR